MEKFDIIIQGGQSNAEGSGRGPSIYEYEPSDDIYYLNAPKKVENVEGGVGVTFTGEPFVLSIAKEREDANGKIGDFSLAFAKKYIADGKLEKGRKLLIIRSAVGGTGYAFGHWGVGKPLQEKMLGMTDYALSLNSENRIVAFLWHQGEHEAVYRTKPDDFKKYLLATIDAVRSRYALPALPFVCADFVQHWKMHNLDWCNPIIAKMKEITEEINDACFVETKGLLSNDRKHNNGDTIHFSREALHELGERYYMAYKHILTK